MSFEPREQQTIYESLRNRLTGKIPDLTNFTDTSFNWVWTQSFSAEFRDAELDKTAAYLSGLIDYAGGPLEEEDLEELGIDDVATVEEINSRLNDEDLDELVKIVGTERDEGTSATGVVTFTTQSPPTTIEAGTSVGLQPESDGTFLEYTTNETVSTGTGVTTVQVSVTATDIGDEYNVGANSITYMPSPPTGVQGVTNTTATSGGEDRETNNELRERAKNAIFEGSGGGTVEGIQGYIQSNVDNVDEVEVVEFFTGDAWHGSYPHAHVIVSGGIESEIEEAIEASRPVAVQHVLVRPDSYEIRVDAVLEGSDIDTDRVESTVTEYLDTLGLNDEVVDSKIIQRIMNADSDIEDIQSLELYIEEEPIFFDSAIDVYNLNQGGIMADDGITEVTGTLSGSPHTFVEDTDYQEWNSSAGDTSTPHDSIDWSLAGDDPDVNTGQSQVLTYSADTDEYLVDEAMITDGITSVTDASSDTYIEGTDFEEVDVRADGVINGIDWGIGGANPDDGEEFTVTYDAGTQFFTTYLIQSGSDIQFDEQSLALSGTVNITVA